MSAVGRIVVVLIACAVTACGASPTTASPAAGVSTLETVVLAFTDLASFTTAGAIARVTAIGVFTNGTTRDVTATCTAWQSDNPAVLSITSAGLLIAQSSGGSATIAATCDHIQAHGLVTVNPPLSSLPPANPLPAQCTNPPYLWDSDPKVLRCRESSTGRFAASVCCGH